jgi:putative endopeptidase
LVGLTAAHRAAFKDKTPNPELEKAFYTQYARIWCEVIRPKFAELRNKTNPHASGMARANQQIRQQEPFRQAFQCKETDAMVLPKEKLVHLW